MLDTPIADFSVLGKRLSKILVKMGIVTLRDLLFHFPYRFDDFSNVVPVDKLAPGMTVTVRGRLDLIRNRRSFRRKTNLTEAILSDDTGSVKLLWFNQPYLTKNLVPGDWLSLSGKVTGSMLDFRLMNPAYEKIKEGGEAVHTARLVPVYSTIAGVTQKQIRALIAAVLPASIDNVEEWLPQDVIIAQGLPAISEALQAIHFPDDVALAVRARARFAFEEVFLLQMGSVLLKRQLATQAAVPVPFHKENISEFITALPFKLTDSQQQSVNEIIGDIGQAHPMNRLLEGDVGSGKTVVSAIVAANVSISGHQSAYMAPTELLARQQFAVLSKLYRGMDISVGLLTLSEVAVFGTAVTLDDNLTLPKKKKALLAMIADGEVAVVVGTHALIQGTVVFNDLVLAIVDEQHRFGVGQRKALREKGRYGSMPHLLSMTATPIPRSMALALYGDLDLSIIDSLPAGRKEIITKIVPERYRDWTYDFVKKEVKKGRQVFVVCPLIDPSDVLEARSVTDEFERLSEDVFPDLNVAMLHGKMKPVDKAAVMNDMVKGVINVLVCTSVVEVGVDIPNATLMLIEGAERFGLAQLHQFRGRVGRGAHQSYCFLLPSNQEKEELARLKALVTCSNGFELAEKDLELRGPGDMYGRRQSGLPELQLADMSDVVLIKKARDYALHYADELDHYPLLQQRVKDMERSVHLE